MFDSLFVYENAPVESKLFSSAEELQARSDTARTHTNYPLTVVVYPGMTWDCIYRTTSATSTRRQSTVC